MIGLLRSSLLACVPSTRNRTRGPRDRLCVLGVVLLALNACGGGGDSSGGSGGGASLQVLSPTSLTVTALLTDQAPTTLVQAEVVANASAQFYIAAGVTKSGVASIGLAANGSVANITIQFKPPAQLGLGTYHDTLTIEGCYDQPCNQQVTNSPQTIAITYTVTVPQPQVNGLTPSSATAGAPAFTLTVNGFNFAANSQVQWNGSPRATTYVNGDQLTAQITQADVASPGAALVTVATGNSVSNATTFTINPLPALEFDQVSPKQVIAGGGQFYVAAIGNGFTAGSAIAWNGTPLTTTYMSGTLLRALVTADQIANVGSASVTVVNPPGQGGTSAPQTLTIVAPTVDAVSYQINPAHTGAITFKTVSLPSGSTWSVDVGGTPSYALIVGGRVFVTVAINGNSQLLALDGATGATLWGPIALTGNVNAAYDGGRLFVVSGTFASQIISALDAATGDSLWSAMLTGDGFPAPPVAGYGIVYANSTGVVTAFDETSGAQLWTSVVGGTDGTVALAVDGVYASPICTAIDLQPAVGTTIWFSNDGCEGGGGATPVVADGVLYSPDDPGGVSGRVFDAESGALKGNFSAAYKPAFTSDTGFFLSGGTLQGLKRSNNQVLWSFAGDGQLQTAPIVVNNYVFVGSGGGNLYALDAVTGQQVWTQKLAAIPASMENGSPLYTGLAAGDGLLVVPNGTKVTAYTLSTSP